MILRAFLLCIVFAAPAAAQNDAAAQARAAVAMLEDAAEKLDAAGGARDRVRALTETILAFETGLASMRTGLRQAAIRESQLSARLEARDGEVGQLLAVLQGMGSTTPKALLHPDGPTGTARAGLLLAELTPALNKRADQLRRDLEDVQTLRTLQTDAEERLRTSLTAVQDARTALNQAIAERTDLPKRFTEDPVSTAILIASTETLDGFASGLSEIVTGENINVETPINIEGQIGALPLPVQSLVLRGMNEADAAGIKRPGLLLAARPRAIVTSPTAATIRYQGPLLDFGNVMILEPRADTLFILAGLETVYGEIGQVLAAGAPIGLMGGPETSGELSTDGDGTGTERSETLYIEVRQDNVPQDPASWFRTDKDG
ncbi:murein hydrolase activator EnvC family protein [Sulfitobacter donghicola]|uniref:Peptidase M23B n=1 Tax=Sulfitobacter donghicola DSW-25 = KCTC 12864 = JCM 14565 TaxID=1300350 RepID=A0A073ILW0_9RHOB|nr:peptidoglycan DD-metalloendopeptidase family protein [Sulfitobacter donghicola]KEJ90481.1 peptidase M23B [Sulfitobacter donghicola DSW-25 = KCTC 12864 = JCM 14565]KIN67721.1 Peptidase M23B [Sulfitobacter donghicola DSW-25 = KCTC 12864 = JCM 14565]